jgi:hypothetical protein
MRTINIKCILIAVAVVLGLAACNDAEDPIENRVYLSESIGLSNTSLFVIPDDGTQVSVSPRISQPIGNDLEVEVYVNGDALEAYNKANGTTYQLMDGNRYKILNSKVVIPAGKVAGEPVTVKLDALIPDENKTGFTYALPLAVRPVSGGPQVLESASTYYFGAMPVPMADVPQFTKYCTLKLPLSQDYELAEWTFETLFNANYFTGASSNTWMASGAGYNEAGTGYGIANGFMLRLGDAGVQGNILNGRLQASAKVTSPDGLKTNVWHHVAVVSGGGKIDVYIDGSRSYGGNVALDVVKFVKEQGIRLAGENRTGANLRTTTRYRYSQVRLWSEARTADQLKNNMYGVPEDSPNLIGYWKLDSYTEGKATVYKEDNKIDSGDTMEIDTYFFKDYTGKNPDGFVDRNPALNPDGLLFDKDKRIEIGYKYDGTKN